MGAAQSATFTVLATGTAPNYQWFRSGAPIDGAMGATYTTPVNSELDAGHTYAVRVSNAAGSIESASATLTVGNRQRLPQIETQPADQTVAAGQSASFTVQALGAGTLAYQWRLNGSNIADATGASYTTPPAAATGGPLPRYSVRVTNGVGAVTSADATLTASAVAVAPELSQLDLTKTAIVGLTADFAATPTGTAPFSYQWRRDGVPISGATQATYKTAPTTAADDGALFSIVVSNAAGTTTSANIELDVLSQWVGIRETGAMLLAGDRAIDSARAVTTDRDGNVFIAGRTEGQFGYDAPGRTSHAFVAKYSKAGAAIWAHKSQATGNFVNQDAAHGIATDSAGNVYVAGETGGTLPGEVSATGRDVTVTKYANDGTLLWARQFGSNNDDAAYGVAVDASGHVFVGGQGQAQLPGQPPSSGLLFIAKYGSTGDRQWIRQFGAGFANGAAESVRGVAVDGSGSAYVTGVIYAAFAGTPADQDAFAAKFDTNGNRLWFSRPPGLGNDAANAVAVSSDGTALFLTGRTYSDFETAGFPAQNRLCCTAPDVFTMRLDGLTGSVQWARNLTSLPQPNVTYFYDEARSIATNAAGSAVFITGSTLGQMPGDTAKGNEDIFVARYEGNGTRTWVRQFGADIPATGARNDVGHAATLDAEGNLFIAGEVLGSFGLPGRVTNGLDLFIMKLRPADGTSY